MRKASQETSAENGRKKRLKRRRTRRHYKKFDAGKGKKRKRSSGKADISAIRIELNHELDVLQDALEDMVDLLNPGGRLCIITFHSLEDPGL